MRNAARLLRNAMKATCLDTARLAKERIKHIHAYVMSKRKSTTDKTYYGTSEDKY